MPLKVIDLPVNQPSGKLSTESLVPGLTVTTPSCTWVRVRSHGVQCHVASSSSSRVIKSSSISTFSPFLLKKVTSLGPPSVASVQKVPNYSSMTERPLCTMPPCGNRFVNQGNIPNTSCMITQQSMQALPVFLLSVIIRYIDKTGLPAKLSN